MVESIFSVLTAVSSRVLECAEVFSTALSSRHFEKTLPGKTKPFTVQFVYVFNLIESFQLVTRISR